GLALLSTISGSLYQALTHENERDAAVIAFLRHRQRANADGHRIGILGVGSLAG
ncbi:putative benzoate membrane transport protein, partial [Salmonella enterica subsp. enterica serovar Gaminara str. ATCC BAA-711]